MLNTCAQIYAGLFFCFHHTEELKLSSGPLSLAALRHSKCQSRSTQKAQASFTACFKTMPRWVNWRRVVLSSDPGSNAVPSGSQVWQVCWHAAVLMPLECFLHTSTVWSILILISEEKQWLVQWAAFSSCYQHWCHDQSFICVVESSVVNGSELTEIGNVVVPKEQIKNIPLTQEQEVSVCWETRPTFPMALQAQSSFISWGVSCISC